MIRAYVREQKFEKALDHKLSPLKKHQLRERGEIYAHRLSLYLLKLQRHQEKKACSREPTYRTLKNSSSDLKCLPNSSCIWYILVLNGNGPKGKIRHSRDPSP